MFDVSAKYNTLRQACARACVRMTPETQVALREGRLPKGNALEVAKVAAVQAAKETSRIIPYCHPIPVDYVGVEYAFHADRVEVDVIVKATYRTGVEMEALTAASVAALTIYDMLKMLDDTLEIVGVRLLEKSGGKSDFREAFPTPLRAAVLVMSDTIAAGKKSDRSGRLIVERLEREGLQVVCYDIIPDDCQTIMDRVRRYADEDKLDLVVSTGGTGFSPRDCTPEAMSHVIEREAPGIGEALRAYGQQRTPYSMLSRAVAGLRGKTLVVTLPGSTGGVRDSLDALLPGLLHAFPMIWGRDGHKPRGNGR